jgi:hypothetical protein
MKILERFFTKKNQTQTLTNPNEIDWNKIDLEKANFILQEGEKLMRTVLANYDSLDNKSALIRTFLTASLTALFGILKFGDASYQKPLIGLIIAFCIALAILSLCYISERFPTIGTSPEELLKAKYNSEDLRFLICCQLQTYSTRIAKAKSINETKGLFINIALVIISLSFLLSFLYLLKSVFIGS